MNTFSRCLPPPRVRQAVILVGGKGTRLGDLTLVTPKPLMPIADDRVFLDLLLDNVARQGFDRILLLAGYLSEQLVTRYDRRKILQAEIRVIVEPEPMGTSGALRFAEAALDDRFLVANGDTYFDMNYRSLDRAFADVPDCLAAMALRRVPDAARYGSVAVEEAPIGCAVPIKAFHEKKAFEVASSGLINAGVYMMSRQALTYIPDGASSLEQDVFPKLAAVGCLLGIEATGYFIDIGLPETLAQARSDLPDLVHRPAIFLDRDGVLNIDHNYVHRWDEFDWIADAQKVVRRFNDAGYFVFVVTNQAGVAHGYYDEQAVHALHDRVQDALAEGGGFVDRFFYCPYHPNGRVLEYRYASHADRKPAPGMILRALAEWPVDSARSFLVGDRITDVAAATAAGIPGLLFAGGSLYEFIKSEGRLPMPIDGNEAL